jgi:hypothetical protein
MRAYIFSIWVGLDLMGLDHGVDIFDTQMLFYY